MILRVIKSMVISCAGAEWKRNLWETFTVSVDFLNKRRCLSTWAAPLRAASDFSWRVGSQAWTHVSTVLLVRAKLGTPCCRWMFQLTSLINIAVWVPGPHLQGQPVTSHEEWAVERGCMSVLSCLFMLNLAHPAAGGRFNTVSAPGRCSHITNYLSCQNVGVDKCWLPCHQGDWILYGGA